MATTESELRTFVRGIAEMDLGVNAQLDEVIEAARELIAGELVALPLAATSPERARDVALSINTVKSAHFTRRHTSGPDETAMRGVVADSSTGIEFDVRLKGDTWYVSDDDGRAYGHKVLETAILAAIEANRD